MSSRLHINFAGLELRSPILVSAGPCTRTVRQIQELAKAGVGAVVTKSTALEKEYSQLVKPYALHRFPDCRPKYVKAGHDTYVYVAGFHEVPAEIWAERIVELKRTTDIPIIASQFATSFEGHAKVAAMFEAAGADGIEFDCVCPLPILGEAEMAGLEASLLHPELIGRAVAAVKKRVSIPVGIKVVFNPVDPIPMFDTIRSSKPDFIHVYYSPTAMTNIDLDTGKPLLPSPTCGVTGPMKRLINYRYVAQAARHLGLDNPPLTASGHAMTWRDCVEYMMYGCTTIQVNHAVMSHGPEVITRLNRDLEKFLAEKGYSSISEIRGKALPHLFSSQKRFYDFYGQTKGIIVAEEIPGRCNGCGICEQTCPSYAIKVEGAGPAVSKELCEGCGLCVANCPVEALRLANAEVMYNFIQ